MAAVQVVWVGMVAAICLKDMFYRLRKHRMLQHFATGNWLQNFQKATDSLTLFSGLCSSWPCDATFVRCRWDPLCFSNALSHMIWHETILKFQSIFHNIFHILISFGKTSDPILVELKPTCSNSHSGGLFIMSNIMQMPFATSSRWSDWLPQLWTFEWNKKHGWTQRKHMVLNRDMSWICQSSIMESFLTAEKHLQLLVPEVSLWPLDAKQVQQQQQQWQQRRRRPSLGIFGDDDSKATRNSGANFLKFHCKRLTSATCTTTTTTWTTTTWTTST